MTRDEADQMALDFMQKFPHLRQCSLDGFLVEHDQHFTQAQREEGWDILSWFPEYGGADFVEVAA